jgi:hypothetical protein
MQRVCQFGTDERIDSSPRAVFQNPGDDWAGPIKEAAAIEAAGVAPMIAKSLGKFVAMPMLTIPDAVNMKANTRMARSDFF